MSPVPAAPAASALVADQAATPDAPAIVAGDVRWTYAELDPAVTRAAGALRSIGVGPGSRVGAARGQHGAVPAAAFGAHRLGARVDAFNRSMLEILDLAELAAAGASAFLFVGAPLLLQGSTGSPLTRWRSCDRARSAAARPPGFIGPREPGRRSGPPAADW